MDHLVDREQAVSGVTDRMANAVAANMPDRGAEPGGSRLEMPNTGDAGPAPERGRRAALRITGMRDTLNGYAAMVPRARS